MLKNSDHKEKNQSFFGIAISKENAILFSFISLSLVISLLPIYYGYFRDELYYIALSKNLAWGYVDVPPLMPFCIAIVRFFFGESLFAMHIIPAVCGVITLVVAREIVKKLGGGLIAQVLVLLCLTLSPVYVAIHAHILYDCFDHLFWALCLYVLVLLLTSGDKKYWIYFGVFAGIGLMGKLGMLWLGAGVVLAMLLTAERKYFATWQFWLGGAIALLIVAPYLVWIAQHQFLAIEYFINYAQSTAPLTILNFLKLQILAVNPLSLPVWALGLYYFLCNQDGRKFRLFGFAYISIFVICLLQQAKFYTILPFFPVLFAGGAILIEKNAQKFRSLYFACIVYAVLIAVAGLLIMPQFRPILPVDLLVKYLNFTHLHKSGDKMNTEKLKLGLLPQGFADCFGWEEMTAEVARVYYALPEKQRANTVIVASNYGEASAIYFYGAKYHLPMPISQHLQYYVWGYQNATESSTYILVGSHDPKVLEKSVCKKVERVGEIYNKYAMPYENQPVYLCTGLRKPIKEEWEKGKGMHM